MTITCRGRNLLVLPAPAEAIFEVSDTDVIRDNTHTSSPAPDTIVEGRGLTTKPRLTTIQDAPQHAP